MDKAAQGKIIEYRRSKLKNRTVIVILCNEDIFRLKAENQTPPPMVIIFRDAFEKGVALSDLEVNETRAIQRKLS
jgi:hypothetical protein